jgi:aspartate aminotransferase-like enzyme
MTAPPNVRAAAGPLAGLLDAVRERVGDALDAPVLVGASPAYPLLLSALTDQAAPLLVVTARTDQAERLAGEMGAFLSQDRVALVDSVPLAAGDRVLVSEVEYGANAVALLRIAERTGARVEVVPSDRYGQFDVDALRGMLDKRVVLVSLVHVVLLGAAGLVLLIAVTLDAMSRRSRKTHARG